MVGWELEIREWRIENGEWRMENGEWGMCAIYDILMHNFILKVFVSPLGLCFLLEPL